MKKSIGGDRLGSGNKMQVELHNYDRSTHNLSRDWRSTMSVGTLVPCFCEVGLNGDTFDIDIKELTKTLPTNQPLFGSFKMQVDFFECPIRLYNGLLHNNMQKIGMDMSKVLFPTIEFEMPSIKASDFQALTSKNQFASDSLLSYLGLKGVGIRRDGTQIMVQSRKFNAVPVLAYYDIFKNYYANKQENNAYFISFEQNVITPFNFVENITVLNSDFGTETKTIIDSNHGIEIKDLIDSTANNVVDTFEATFQVKFTNNTPKWSDIVINDIHTLIDNINYWNTPNGLPCQVKINDYTLSNEKHSFVFDFNPAGSSEQKNVMKIEFTAPADKTINIHYVVGRNLYDVGGLGGIFTKISFSGIGETTRTEAPILKPFPLENIDQMRINILKNTGLGQAVNINEDTILPYGDLPKKINGINYLSGQSQVGLCVKTYQSDLFNNWLSSEWIEGANGIAEITAIDTSKGNFTMDTLNLSQKVYNMLNRIAVSGGSYEDWQEAVYGEDAIRRAESPIYIGGLSAEIAFEEVVSTATTEGQPLGTLGGKGTTTGHKGGNITVKVKEPCIIMGIASITPRIDYYQGNKWYMTELKTMNDLHKPALDGIGFQSLMSEQMAWWSYDSKEDSSKAIGKVPAWINYMTAVNETHGNFAGVDMNEASMVLNRNYESEVDENGQLQIKDATTYIDPQKYNYVWSENLLTSQYFWVQLGFNVTARRKMSAKIIPNL